LAHIIDKVSGQGGQQEVSSARAASAVIGADSEARSNRVETRPVTQIENVTKRYGNFTALDGISAEIHKGEFFSLLGPSGCGKTTLLRMIGGFDEPTSGTIRIGGEDMTGVPANLRPTNMVFQSYAIFPHLNVRDNVAYGLRRQRLGRAEADRDAFGLRAVTAELNASEVLARARADVDAARASVEGAVAETRAASEALQRERSAISRACATTTSRLAPSCALRHSLAFSRNSTTAGSTR
jgi:ABC-type sugar transport system ATPase subunit